MWSIIQPVVILFTFYLLQVTSLCSVCTKFPVLPGTGWDCLQNKVMNQVFLFNYTRSKTTDDELFLIPDQVYFLPENNKDAILFTQSIEDMRDFRSVISNQFHIDPDLLTLQGSYSSEYINLKEKQNKYNSTIFRLHMRFPKFKLEISPNLEITTNLRSKFMNALEAIEVNDDQMLEYILENIVRDYGTHFVTSVDAGALLVIEYYFSKFSELYSDKNNSEILSLLMLEFESVLHLGLFKEDLSKNNTEHINILDTTNGKLFIQNIGSIAFDRNTSMSHWLDSINSNIAVIGYSGYPLHYLITSSVFPSTTFPKFIETLRIKLAETVNKYYDINTYKGCRDLDASNYDPNANVEDATCSISTHKYSFGGIYQTCSLDILAGNSVICKNTWSYINPLTNDFSCHKNITSIKIASLDEVRFYSKPSVIVHRNITTYWCPPLENSSISSTLLFGGAVSHLSQCPPGYQKFFFVEYYGVCLSKPTLTTQKYSISFGGFFSCDNGNPLAGGYKKCPPGYEETEVGGNRPCQIYCCIEKKIGKNMHPIKRPPFSNYSVITSTTKLHQPTIKSVSTVKAHRILSSSIGEGKQNHKTVIIAVCVVILMLVIGSVIWYSMKQRKARLNNFNFQ